MESSSSLWTNMPLTHTFLSAITTQTTIRRRFTYNQGYYEPNI